MLGSGLGRLAEEVEGRISIPYAEIPGFPPVHAAGHAGNLILGSLCDLPVALLQGRAHRYEGWSNEQVSFPIHCVQALGAQVLITTNAAGGLNTRFQTGDLMVIDTHIDLLWWRGGGNYQSHQSHTRVRGESLYDYSLIRQAQSIARRHDIVLHTGCYLATLGPTYETRSEYRMFRWIGADAVGMSTVPEVLTSRHLGMKTLAFSVITNVASTDIPQSTTHQEVVDVGRTVGPRLMTIVKEMLSNLFDVEQET